MITVLNPIIGEDLIITVFYRIVIVIIIIIILSILMLVFHSLETPLHHSDTLEFKVKPRSFLTRYLLFSPWFEELVFRLLLMDLYFHSEFGLDKVLASVGSSVFFAGFHLFYVFEETSSFKGLFVEFTFLFVGGMTMAVIYWAEGILVAIIAHFVINVIECYSLFSSIREKSSVND